MVLAYRWGASGGWRNGRRMQDWQLDAFRRVNHMPERETEQPRDVLGGLPGRHERGSAEGELLAGQADAAVADRADSTGQRNTGWVLGL
jgi:hypothetical protein